MEEAPRGWNGISGKLVVITGATGGIGLAAAQALGRKGARLALVARSEARADAAEASIRAVAGAGVVIDKLKADLTSQADVRRLATEVRSRYGQLDVLINNAGAIYSHRQLSRDGIELTWALNHLAPFLLTTLLLDLLKSSAPARVITTSSMAHRGVRIPFDDLNAERGYRSYRRYGESKLANILFTVELARRLEGSGVTANCFHPGFVATGFNRNNGAFMNWLMKTAGPLARSPERGADTLVWLADSPDLGGVSGQYFTDRRRRTPSPEAQNAETARRLWDASMAQTADRHG